VKVLVVSYYSLWSSSAGARRMNGLVRGLVERGDEVVLVAATPANGLRAEPVPGVRLIETRACDRVVTARRLVRRLLRRGSGTPSPTAAAPTSAATGRATRLSGVAALVRPWVSFPDTMWEWRYAARRAAIADGFVPDVVVASAPPMAALRAARDIAAHHGCPWVADMRDLWTGDPYRQVPRIVRRLDARLERSTLRSAAAITTVADVMIDELQPIAPGVPITAMRNGFDPAWVRRDDLPPAAPPSAVFTGTLTSNTGRDLTALCEAAELLIERHGPDAAPRIEIYGAADPALVAAAQARSRPTVLRFRGIVGAADVRRVQHEAGALLNFSWEDAREFHKCPAKLFEYAAARRPIVHIGRVESLGVQLIRQHGLGVVVSPEDPVAIADAIERCCVAGAGEAGWDPPSVDDLAPLSQRAMIDGFLAVLRAASDAGRATDGDHTDTG
jgi:glycosyltransferase involved in cell wall biosynthesis